MKNSEKVFLRLPIAVVLCALTILNACQEEAENPIVHDNRTIVTFAESTVTISENSTSGIVVHLNLSKPAIDNTTLLVLCPYFDYNNVNIIYGSIYVTTPSMVIDGFIPLSVQKGATSIEFIVLPINNAIDNANITLVFSMDHIVGFLAVDTYTLTIEDDD